VTVRILDNLLATAKTQLSLDGVSFAL